MVNAKNQIKVMDFGLAKLKGSLKLTKTSSTVGTLAYMAPEQIQGGEVDARSDIFSFGVVLYEILTGRLPFHGEYESAMMYSIVNEEPEPIQKNVPEISSEIVHIVNRALEKDPEDRYQTVQEMVIDLRRAKKDTSRVSRTFAKVMSVAEGPGVVLEEQRATATIRQKKTQRIFLMAGLAGVLVLVIGIVLFTVFRSRAPQLNPNMTFRTLTIPFTQIEYPGLSRDGNWVAFGARGAQEDWALYFMNVSKGDPRRLTEDRFENISYCDISPDGGEVVYVGREFGKPQGGFIVSSNGGKSRKIVEAGVVCKWRPDGQRIGYIRTGRPNDPSSSGMREFWTVKPDGSDNRLEFVDSLSYVLTDYCFDWSPDGKSVVWLRSFSDYGEILIRDLKSGSQSRLSLDRQRIDEVTWASNGAILFSSNRNGNTNIWMVPAKGGKAAQVTKGTGPDLGVRISADTKRLLFFERRQISHLWTCDIDGSHARQLTFDDQYLEIPSFSPDGKRIAFDMQSADMLQPSNHIYIIQSDGTNRTRLTSGDDMFFNAEWSPDGRHMAYASKRVEEPYDSSRIYLIDVEKPAASRRIGQGVDVRWVDEQNFVVSTPLIFFRPRSAIYSINNSGPINISEDSTIAFPLPGGRHLVVADARKGRQGVWLKPTGAGPSDGAKMILSSKTLFSIYPSVSLRYILYQEADGSVWRISVPECRHEKMPEILTGIKPQLNIQTSFDDQKLVFLKPQVDSRLVLIEAVFK
jgi:Tol biopolymer transport system component